MKTFATLVPILSLCSTLFVSLPARATPQGFADPPDSPSPVVVADQQPVDQDRPSDIPRQPFYDDSLPTTYFRLFVGGAGRFTQETMRPGLNVMVDYGRGPATFRLNGTWIRVGFDDPLSQYTGEIALTFLNHSRWLPSLGAGGGLARTYRVDDQGAKTTGSSNLGVGVVRAGIEYLLPFPGTDARIGLNTSLSFPAMRSSGAPDLSPWVITALNVGVGF
jgi:hypothetical protein